MDVFYNKLEADPSTIGMDVVGGRLDLVSATSIWWSFLNSNQIRLVNPDTGRWELVKVATEPTIANTALDMNGTALVPNTIYDVFAEYDSSTAFNLVLSRWATGGDGANNSSTSYATPVMTSNTAPGPVVASAIDMSSDAYKAFMQDDVYCWTTGNTSHPHSLTVDFGTPVCINKYALKSRNNADSGNYFPSNFVLQASNDGATFVDVETSRTGVAYPGQNTWSSYFTFLNSTTYRYYRLNITASTGGTNYDVINELKLVASANSLAGSSSRVRAYESTVTYAIGDRVTYGGHDWVKQSSAAAGTTPVAGVNWVDNGTSVSGDFAGLYRHDGVLVSDSSDAGKSRRWLGIIYTYNNGGTVNFKDDVNYRFISNFYNRLNKRGLAYVSTGTWTYTTGTYREQNGGSNMTRGNCVFAITNEVYLTIGIQAAGTSGCVMDTAIGVNTTSTATVLSGRFCSLPDGYNVGGVRTGSYTVSPGFHYFTSLEYGLSNPGYTIYANSLTNRVEIFMLA